MSGWGFSLIAACSQYLAKQEPGVPLTVFTLATSTARDDI